MVTGVDWNRARVVSSLALIAWLAAGSLGVDASEPIRIRVVPTFALSPADVTVEAIVEPDARNRSVEVAVDSASFFTTSTVSLEGDRAARVREIRFRQLPAGSYEVSATLVQERGVRSKVAVILEVQ